MTDDGCRIRESTLVRLLFVVRYYRYSSLVLVLGQKLRLDAYDLGLWSALSLSRREGKFPHLSSSPPPPAGTPRSSPPKSTQCMPSVKLSGYTMRRAVRAVVHSAPPPCHLAGVPCIVDGDASSCSVRLVARMSMSHQSRVLVLGGGGFRHDFVPWFGTRIPTSPEDPPTSFRRGFPLTVTMADPPNIQYNYNYLKQPFSLFDLDRPRVGPRMFEMFSMLDGTIYIKALG